MEELTPRQIVEELDKYIIGQDDAKRSVAIALRNRYRRQQIDSELKDEIIPKNILMIGPTGVGKTEIARRLANLAGSPFLKVEVSKFTEVGYMGRDVESMVRDLVETSIRMVEEERRKKVRDKARELAEERILDKLLPGSEAGEKKDNLESLYFEDSDDEDSPIKKKEVDERKKRRRDRFRRHLRSGYFDDQMIEIEVKEDGKQMFEIFSGAGMEEMGINMEDMFGSMLPSRSKNRRVTVEKALKILTEQEASKLIDTEEVSTEAINRVEQEGILFLDEIDKIAGRESDSGPEVSREGVQRDILPIVEGSTVNTKHGSVATDHILFMAAGAFHVADPSDLIPELQGRFPLRVELDSLTEEDFVEILEQPQNALTKQYRELLAVEDQELIFEKSAIEQIASYAAEINDQTENIGARRLHTIMEKVVEEISFQAPEMEAGKIEIDDEYVRESLESIVEDRDLSRYIL
ncbi:ATP-dependent protease ATPase subunit HslU [Halarsenatibacter silvermanii]|uniref:ATP-dependent protease ATPase subunit HslU n=1 Tax=Halarsenatibacter silvermanii TaxID=321763 RepID=A0A1G9LEP9_9FIRM|nr:ATP-dependent protease ATPase subunit HslU [Halarsenatibacter silvermanii]SDL60479.1 ATP-dependent HslUV protease ATP-binding subunit HslU [Halarsenatibacter silvermanii]